MEAGLLAIKLLRLTGRLLSQIFRIFSGFFRFLFQGIFYSILVKIYYTFFRLKKNELANKTWRELINNKLVYIFLIGLTAVFIFSNLKDQARASAMGTKISQTVLANLISDDLVFRAPTEELIQETMSPEGLSALSREKYIEDPDTLTKDQESKTPVPATTDWPIFNDQGDVALKPLAPNLSPNAETAGPTERTEIISYEVQPGDTVSSIARRFNISVNTVLWANNLSAYSLIRPGNRLTILPYSGLLYKVKSGDTLSRLAALYSIEADKILAVNDLAGGLKAGQEIILPGASRLAAPQAAPQPSQSYTGISAIRDLIQSPPAKVSGDKMAWPTIGSRITQYFSWRHNGLDIANKIGTEIYAADDGVVEVAASGYNGGYGLTIVINHGGGIKTRYAHASKLFVKVGDQVEKGENIAAMGSTGRSTGSHLHFEVMVNGVRKNPLDYIR